MAVEAPAAQKSEETVDLGALANAGLPKDVTPEEIAALAAAAARIKGKIAEPSREEAVSEIAAVQAASVDAPASGAEVAATEAVSESKESETKAAAESEQVSSAVGHSQESTEEQSVTAAIGPSSQEVSEAAGEPVTMAAAAAVGQSFSQASRWTAVSVALAPEETGISLEEEMQKAYAEFAAAETGHAASITADSLNSSRRGSVRVGSGDGCARSAAGSERGGQRGRGSGNGCGQRTRTGGKRVRGVRT